LNEPTAKKRGTVMRAMREGDRVILSLAGHELGEIELAAVPHDAKIKVALRFDLDVEITSERRKRTP
jgi:uncharacterized membrane protein